MTSQNDGNLWEELQIFFRLESNVISDNKITGSLNFTPEHAFKLIKNFKVSFKSRSIIIMSFH